MPFANTYDFFAGFWATIYPIHKCQMQDCWTCLKHTCSISFLQGVRKGAGEQEAVCGWGGGKEMKDVTHRDDQEAVGEE